MLLWYFIKLFKLNQKFWYTEGIFKRSSMLKHHVWWYLKGKYKSRPSALGHVQNTFRKDAGLQYACVHRSMCKVEKIPGISDFTSSEVQARWALDYCICQVFWSNSYLLWLFFNLKRLNVSYLWLCYQILSPKCF